MCEKTTPVVFSVDLGGPWPFFGFLVRTSCCSRIRFTARSRNLGRPDKRDSTPRPPEFHENPSLYANFGIQRQRARGSVDEVARWRCALDSKPFSQGHCGVLGDAVGQCPHLSRSRSCSVQAEGRSIGHLAGITWRRGWMTQNVVSK